MSPAVAKLLHSALQLSDDEQRALASRLLSAIGEERVHPFSDAWAAEVERRFKEFEAGTAAARPWREVKERTKQP